MLKQSRILIEFNVHICTSPSLVQVGVVRSRSIWVFTYQPAVGDDIRIGS